MDNRKVGNDERDLLREGLHKKLCSATKIENLVALKLTVYGGASIAFNHIHTGLVVAAS